MSWECHQCLFLNCHPEPGSGSDKFAIFYPHYQTNSHTEALAEVSYAPNSNKKIFCIRSECRK